MKQYYQDIVTGKSWHLLQDLKKSLSFVLIGGWAVYLYTNALKSKDIDIIVDYGQLPQLETFGELYKNERLSKYEVKKGEVDIDIYLPHYSNLGIPVEVVTKHTQKVASFVVPKKEVLVLTKLFAYQNRKASAKGQKDKIDILGLLFTEGFDFNQLNTIALEYQQSKLLKTLRDIVLTTYEVKELGLNRHQFAQQKKDIALKIAKY